MVYVYASMYRARRGHRAAKTSAARRSLYRTSPVQCCSFAYVAIVIVTLLLVNCTGGDVVCALEYEEPPPCRLPSLDVFVYTRCGPRETRTHRLLRIRFHTVENKLIDTKFRLVFDELLSMFDDLSNEREKKKCGP